MYLFSCSGRHWSATHGRLMNTVNMCLKDPSGDNAVCIETL